MIKSMTSFGRGQAPAGDGTWIAELRTVNSRFLDPHLRLPSSLAGLEERVKKYLGARFSRGRVNLSLSLTGAPEAQPRLVLNRPLLAQYRRVLEEMRAELDLSGSEAGLLPFLNNRDLIMAEESDPDLEQIWNQIEPALAGALDEAEDMRTTEGASLAQDLTQRMERLRELFAQAAARAPEVVDNYRKRLQDRLARLTEEVEVDPQRIALEVAVLADKCDVTEEAVRAQSHLDQFATFLAATEPVGRKLDFLLQELNREANTMGSKLPDASASQLVVEMKAELERIREQVQNIE